MASTPHDAFFKAVFGQVEHAVGCFRAYLPPAVLRQLDLDTAELVPGSFVDDALGQRHCDLLWQVGASGRPALLYLLFEHQRTADALMPFRLLEYAVRIWGRWLGERPARRTEQRLPPVIPLVLHQGSTRWTGPDRLSALYGGTEQDRDDLRPWAPELVPLIVDLPLLAEEQLLGTPLGRLALLLMKHVNAPDLVERVRAASSLIIQVRRESGLRTVEQVVRYILEADVQPERLASALPNEEPDIREVVMSTAEKLREEGRREGERRARLRIVVKLLGLRFGELSPAVLEKIDGADDAALDLYAERVLTAPTLEVLLSDP